ncbi:Rpn family recombination-promoting nuclease/putative transposase [Pannus brasiliensis CCIBt3594]|uniref:Rpn family recombination-promoting nuclease/putative transposase n=1 Tax=Pannus brasiliensis CCIBt3594 TaxID=1427578 RepID=A0AAW9R1E2_9CHRO
MYDNICQFLAESFSDDFARWLLGEPVSLTRLSPNELSLEPLRADALILLAAPEVVLHIEFQTEPRPDIPFRMADYRLRVYRRYPDRRMEQVVIYLKPSRSELVYWQSFEIPGTRHEFRVIRLWEQPEEVFWQSPGLLPLAVLSRSEDRERTLGEVARRIEGIENRRQQSNVAASTAILAGLLLEKEVIERLLRQELMRESVIYQEIIAEGKAQGKAEGKAEGKREEGIALVLRLLGKRFGSVPIEWQERVQNLSLDRLEDLGEALLDFTARSEVDAWFDRLD